MNQLRQRLQRLIRSVISEGIRLYYPLIEISNPERIPKNDQPLLLLANHPNSLLDPFLISIAAKRPVQFLAKAPLFEIPLLGKILRALGMVPAYRASDDASKISRNLESLSIAADHLCNGATVGLFPEGKSHDLPKVEQIRSGAARIAIEAARKGAANLVVIPIGLNYQRKEKFRSAVWIQVGKPISVNQWLENDPNVNRVRRALTEEFDRQLKHLVVHLKETSWETFLNDLETLRPPPPPHHRNPLARLYQRKRIADAMNHFLDRDQPRTETMANEINQHRNDLAREGLRIDSEVIQGDGLRSSLRLAWAALWIILGFIPALVGTIHHLVPFLLTRFIATRLQAPGKTTIALARFGIGIPIYAATYLIAWWAIAHIFMPWIAWRWISLMPVAGIFALHYWEKAATAARLWRQELRMLTRSDRLTQLRDKQQQLRKKLGRLAQDYSDHVGPAQFPQRSFSLRRTMGSLARCGALGLILTTLGLWGVYWLKHGPDHQGPGFNLATLSPKTLATFLDSDEALLANVIKGLEELEAKAAQLQAEFLAGKRSFYSQTDDDLIRQLLLTYINYRTTLSELVWKYQRYEDVSPRKMQHRSFLIGLSAAAALHDSSLKLISRYKESPEAIRKMNEAEPLWGIPPGVYDKVRRNLVHPQTSIWLNSASQRYQQLKPALAKADLIDTPPYQLFHPSIERLIDSRDRVAALSVKASLSDPIEEASRASKAVAYEAQSFISTWLGQTRFRDPREGQALISPRQLAQLASLLKPGDILIERQNWYLSRAFMPGYWAHAAIYVGTAADLEQRNILHDPRLRNHWNNFTANAPPGAKHIVLEAVPEGVRLTTLQRCLGVADSAAVIRPRISAAEATQAIARAFTHLGKPYDFEFDFFSSDKLVCTELVYRAYHDSLQFPLVKVLGRMTMPPTELARKLVTENGTPDAQLDFVCFLEGDENNARASFQPESVFNTTLTRPGLTWLQ